MSRDLEGPSGGGPDREPRPLVERIGLAAIAVLATALFSTIGIAAAASGEWFLGIMGGIGALMTTWAAVTSLRKG